jgi:hypothetical protein
MTITYAGIIDRPGFSSAIQGFVNRLLLPRQRRNNGNALVAVDLSERPTVTAHLPDERSVVATLTARIETLESEFAKVEAAAAVHRADFERERERCERLMAEVLKATAEMMEYQRQMAGAAQADRAQRDAGGGPSRYHHSIRRKPICCHPGRGALAQGGG